jgi:peptidoglycan/LPS O-acetylase OafA/YrhL
MTLLMLFYLVTPLILRKGSNGSILLHGLLFYSTMLVVFLILTKVYSKVGGGIFDIRFFAYFPAYVSGIIVARNKNIMQMIHKSSYGLLCLLLVIIIIMVVPEDGNFSLTDLCVMPLGIIATLYLSEKLSLIIGRNEKIIKCVNFISYCSLCAYLFHRAVYICMQSLFEMFSLKAPYIVLVISFLPLCCIIAYGIQYSYDKMLDWHLNKIKSYTK